MQKIILFSFLFFILFSSVVFAQFRPPVNGNVTLSTTRTSLPSLEVYNCTLQAASTNAGPIYVGGSTVTNAGGSNPGARLPAGVALNNISVRNRSWLYVVADNNGDVVSHLCN